MTVRWKPLLILSGVFLVIAVVGVIAMVYTLVPRGAADILPIARAERKARRYDRAQIHYQRALQKDGRNAAIHEELAGLLAEWSEVAPAEKKAKIQAERLEALHKAAKIGTRLKEPRRLLLADAMRRDVSVESIIWAKELLDLDPKNADAHYVLATEGLDRPAPVVPEIKRHLAGLEAAKGPKVRIAWVKTRLAQQVGDEAAVRTLLTESRSLTLPESADPVDHMALLRLRALDVQSTTDPAELTKRVEALQAETKTLLSGQAPARITRLSLLLEQLQKSLTILASNAAPKDKASITKLVDGIESDVETLFKKALDPANKPELQVYLTYADHLRYRQKRAECLALVQTALDTPLAARPAFADLVMGLHAIAIEAALAKVEDAERFRIAEPHIKKLIESSRPRFQGLGHLFQGAIDLEQSGVGGAADRHHAVATKLTPAAQQKLRASALGHLKRAANELTDVAEAQARYGVALVLSLEPALGRQYLQNALRLGNLDPQYQVWAAWSMVQAGYPEEAEPIVNNLLAQVAQGKQPRDLEGTLHLLNGEIHQARRGHDELLKAQQEYEKSMAGGQPAVQLRQAQIEVQLGQYDRALARIAALRTQGLGGPAAEHLAVLTLQEQNKPEEARKALAEARKRFPDSDELIGLEAALLVNANQPKEADRVLAEFLTREPDNVALVLLRAQVLAEKLDEPKEARKLLLNIADRSENSGALVQLALLDLKAHDHDAVAASVAKIRARWKEAAVADLIDAQLSLDQGNVSAASAHFEDAIRKDPSNKLVQFWKAQLDSRTGATKEATQSLEAIARARPTKEVDAGQTLMAAAESALAGIALDNGDIDGAIHRLEDLRKKQGEVGGLNRADRWQLATAYASKGEWTEAKREIAAILNDPKAPPTFDERVRGANFYRLHNEQDAALAQLDYVIKVNPAHPAAVVTRAYILSVAKKNDESAALLRKAIEASKDKPPAVFYLMLAALDTLDSPGKNASKKALATIDEGLEGQPDSIELVQAKYRVIRLADGPKAAVAFIEAKEKENPKVFRRMLVETYRENKDLDGAERVLRTLAAEAPKDSQVAANLVRIIALQEIDAAEHGDRAKERKLQEAEASLIREYRAKFPGDMAFVQTDCDLAARRGDLARATEITLEMDKLARNSTAGPLTRARIFSAQGRTREAAAAYTEALERNPRQLEVRILLGQASLKLGEPDEAFRQAKFVLDVNPKQPDAILLRSSALAARGGTRSEVLANRKQAIEHLSEAIRNDPKFVEAYHLKAEIQMSQGDREGAVATLKEGLKAQPDDAAGLAHLVQHLAEPRDGGKPPTSAEIDEANAAANAAAKDDAKGNLMLAVSVGFHKANQLELALPWAEKSAKKLDTPVVHLNYGDLLLSTAEASRDPADAKALFRRAVEQYDLVLKAQANSVEAINNKAWVLHTHLGQSRAALDLALGLLKRVDPATLPGEFFDTLGAIQEATGRSREAEESYAKGLSKSPDHPVLNYHMGRLIAADRGRASKASPYLEKARNGRNRLSPSMATDLTSVMQKLGMRGN